MERKVLLKFFFCIAERLKQNNENNNNVMCENDESAVVEDDKVSKIHERNKSRRDDGLSAPFERGFSRGAIKEQTMEPLSRTTRCIEEQTRTRTIGRGEQTIANATRSRSSLRERSNDLRHGLQTRYL